MVWWKRSTLPFVRGRYGSVVRCRISWRASSCRRERFLDVAEAVIGHQPLREDAVLGEVGERPLDEVGHRRRLLVVVELDVGEREWSSTIACA